MNKQLLAIGLGGLIVGVTIGISLGITARRRLIAKNKSLNDKMLRLQLAGEVRDVELHFARERASRLMKHLNPINTEDLHLARKIADKIKQLKTKLNRPFRYPPKPGMN